MENKEAKKQFVFPDIESEIGEIERVAATFSADNQSGFINRFMEKAKAGHLTPLSEETWLKLENTDSFGILAGDWNEVEYHAKAEPVLRDWQALRDKIIGKTPVDTPIIAKIGDTLHLVSGNTRLMVSRAAGIRPEVLIVDMNE